MPKFHYQELEGFAARLLVAAGLGPEQAELTAGLLVKADLQGYPAHGVAHIPSYLHRIQVGLLQVTEPSEVTQESPTTAVIDGKFCFGQVVAHQAMSLAIRKAEEQGVGIVCAFRSGHMGRLADYVELAADHGMIGIATVSVGGASIPAYGGVTGVAGTNPMAFGVPGKGGEHIILDFATAAMSRGELNRKGARGEPIPEGVMLDGQGNPTTDFRLFNTPPRGIMLPFGGHKGSGIHLATDVLGGILAGNGLGRDWRGKGDSAINGGYFQAVRVDAFLPLDRFLDQVEDFVALVNASQRRPGFDEVLVPGQRSRRLADKDRADGIVIDQEEWEHLVRCAEELGLGEAPLPVGA